MNTSYLSQELNTTYKKLTFQKYGKEKYAAGLIIAELEPACQNAKKEKRSAEELKKELKQISYSISHNFHTPRKESGKE